MIGKKTRVSTSSPRHSVWKMSMGDAPRRAWTLDDDDEEANGDDGRETICPNRSFPCVVFVSHSPGRATSHRIASRGVPLELVSAA